MKGLVKTYVVSLAAWSLLATAGPAVAGQLEFQFEEAVFNNPTNVLNDYWPLSALPSAVYASESGDGCEVNEVIVSGDTRGGFGGDYVGIEAIVVEDREWVDEECDGHYLLAERTEDWYAQDDDGNVWYLGEDTTAWDDENGCLTDSGAWEAGVGGAEAGVVILGSPAVGASYLQEYYEDEAEDRAKVLRLDAPVSIAFGDYEGCMKTKEYTPLEPGEVEHKFYCPMSTGAFGLMLINELKGKTKRVEYTGAELPLGVDFPSDFPGTDVCEE